MSLQEKVLKLKLDALLAARHAEHWQKIINEHGEEKATAFYTHLGLNHLEAKRAVEWEGLTLSREPTAAEKLCVKGIANAQESAKAQIGTILTSLRTELIAQGMEAIEGLSPQDYHTLVLEVPEGTKKDLRARLDSVYRLGRKLVAEQLGGRKETPLGDSDDELDTLAGVTNARIVNDVQSRITASMTRFRLLGLFGEALILAVTQEMADGSVSYIDRASTGLANRVISIGRGDEAQERRNEWERVEYSALLDNNVCGPCAAEDGKEAENENDLAPTPNPECEGSDYCRCFHVWIAEGLH